jgi:hypothetical protein
MSVELDKVLADRFYFDYHLSFCSFKYPYWTEWRSSRFQTDATASVGRYYIQVLLQITSTVIPRFTSFIDTSETAGKVKVSEMKVIISRCFPYYKIGLVLKVKNVFHNMRVCLNNTRNVTLV